jgi:formamidopyrimidine-DNA glycosylase
MPELPDVEGFRQILLDGAVGGRVSRVEVLDAGVLRGVEAGTFRREVAGRVLGSPTRHGKWLVVPLHSRGRRHQRDDPSIVFHFGMTGGLAMSDDRPPQRYDRIVFIMAGGLLRYHDMRKLQGVRLLQCDRDVAALLDDLGPDAAAVTAQEFADRLAGRRGRLKPVLMNQRVVAGLGNLLVDEVLWRARLHPARPVAELTGAERSRLLRAMRSVVRQSIKHARVPALPSWLTGHRGREGQPCPRCGTPLQRSRIGGRGTYWCPHCQPP